MFTEVQQLCFSLHLSNSCILLSGKKESDITIRYRPSASPLSKYRPQPFGKPRSGQRWEWTVLFLCPARVTSSAAANSSRMNSRRDMTAEKVGRSEVIMDRYRSRMIARVPRVAEMSAGFIKRHRESFRAVGGRKVCRHHSFCANYIFFFPRPAFFFPLYVCCNVDWEEQGRWSAAASRHWVQTHPVVPNNTWFSCCCCCCCAQLCGDATAPPCC